MPSDPCPSRGPSLSEAEGRYIVALARRSLEEVVRAGTLPQLPLDLPAALLEPRGSFVTLKIGDRLRGCMGNIFAERPLWEAVVNNARSASQRDPRFSAVKEEELALIHVEVSVLSVPQPLSVTSPAELLEKLSDRDLGVVLNRGYHRATFLPQVWEDLPDAADFLARLSKKAGLSASAWQEPDVEYQVYRVQAFHELPP